MSDTGMALTLLTIFIIWCIVNIVNNIKDPSLGSD